MVWDEFYAEVAPFQSDVCSNTGHYEICSAGWGYIDDLTSQIMSRLNDMETNFFTLKESFNCVGNILKK